MSMINWEDVPPQGRLWIFTASSPWQADQMDMVNRQLSMLCHGWTAHGESVAASFTTVDHRLIALTADESALANASGCSIDNMMGQLKSYHKHCTQTFLTECMSTSVPIKQRHGDV